MGADRLWWCAVTEGEVWSRHRTQQAAIRMLDRLDREFDGITYGMPPVLARNAEVGDFYKDLDVVEEGDRSGRAAPRG